MGRINQKMRRAWRAAASFVLPKVPWALRKFTPKLTRPCTHAWVRSESSHQRALSRCYGGKISGSQQKVACNRCKYGRRKTKKLTCITVPVHDDFSQEQNGSPCLFSAYENIRFSSLFAAGDVSFPPRETSPATKSEEKRMFSQARLFSHRLTIQMAISESSLSSKIAEIQKFGYHCNVTSHFSPPLSELQKCPYMSWDKSHNSFLIYF